MLFDVLFTRDHGGPLGHVFKLHNTHQVRSYSKIKLSGIYSLRVYVSWFNVLFAIQVKLKIRTILICTHSSIRLDGLDGEIATDVLVAIAGEVNVEVM